MRYTKDGQVLLSAEVRALHPNISFGPDTYAELGWAEYEEPAPAADVVPGMVSPRQFRMALTRANLRVTVESAVSAADQDIKDWWEYALYVERNNPQLQAMATSLGVSSEALDELFRVAAAL